MILVVSCYPQEAHDTNHQANECFFTVCSFVEDKLEVEMKFFTSLVFGLIVLSLLPLPVQSEVIGNIVIGAGALFSVDINSIRINGSWRAAVVTSAEDSNPMYTGPKLGGIFVVNCQAHQYYHYDDKTNTKSSILPIRQGTVAAGLEQIVCAY